MSLINKMLQDLEGRRLEGEIAGTMPGQVRAAPEPTRIHVAWWIVLGLTLILTGVISWLWGYRAAPAVQAEQPPHLALKLAPNIRIPRTAAPETPAAGEESVSISGAAEPAAPMPQQSTVGMMPEEVADRQTQAGSADATAPDLKPLAVAAPNTSAAPPPAPVPANTVASVRNANPPQAAFAAQPAASAATNKPLSAVAAKDAAVDRPKPKPERANEFDIPANVAKQIKEPTAHQRAEEEYRRATVLLDQGKHSESMTALERALQLDPQHSVARQTLAGLLLEAKRPDEAIRKLQHGLNADKSHPALAMMLARLQVDNGELRPAIETLQRTLPYAEQRSDYQAFLAALLQREGRHKEAAEHYLLALRKSPHNGLWWMGIAISLQADDRPAEARDAFGRAKASNNLSPELLAFVDEKLNQLR